MEEAFQEVSLPEAVEITRLLRQWREQGDKRALDDLVSLVHAELRRLARQAMSSEREGHTLQTTALVNEVYSRLVRSKVTVEDRSHFFKIAARMMRRILVDHARARKRVKRSGSSELCLGDSDQRSLGLEELLDIERALKDLEAMDARKADVVEMTYFGGMSYEEVGVALGISPVTVKRDLRVAKAWLRHELRNGSDR